MFDTPDQPKPIEVAIPPAPPVRLDLNFLPERYRGRRLRFSSLRPWLLMVGFALLLYPSADLFQRRTTELTSIEMQMEAVSAALDGYQPLADERSALEARIAAAEAQISEVQAAYEAIDVQPLRWSELVPRLMSAAPAGVQFSSISQAAEQITIEGLAEAYILPSEYRDALAAFDDFESVTVEIIAKLDTQDQPVPTPTADSDATAEPGDVPAEPVFYQFEITAVLPSPPPTVDAGDGLQ
jgi:Tfp pilus assembly protein PilN